MYEKFRTVSDILWDFKRCERTFPKDAVNRAREHREQIIPNLIEAVRNATAYARFGVPNRDGTVQFAVHLLAEFQATKALPAIEDSLSLSIDQIWDHLYADGFFEAMPGILHRLMGDDPEIYDQKLRDPSAPVALQCCLSRSIGYLVAEGIVSEETYCDWLRDYLEIAIREKKSELVTDLVCDILFAANPEDIPLVRSAFENELVDEDRMPREEAEEWFQERSTSIAEILPDPKRDFADAAKELSGWSWFQDVSKRLSELKTASPVTIDVSESPSDGILHLPPSGRYPIPLPMSNDDEPEPLKALQKIGRNDPCPCGSGKKYKKCCMK